MQLAFSTNAYTNFALSDALHGIQSAGFNAVEILADKPHAYPPDLTPARIDQIRARLDELHLAVSNINANCSFGYWKDAPPEPFFEPSLISPNRAHREDRIAMISRTLEFAQAVGASNISITTGRLLGGMPPEKARIQLEDSLRRVLDRADELGINVGIECEPGLYLEFATELREWIDRLQHSRLGANLDIGHSQVIGEHIPHVVKLLADRIWNIHVEDIPGRKHYHLIPGQGTLDWASFKAALHSIQYSRYLTVELYTYSHAPQLAAEESHRFLSRYFR